MLLRALLVMTPLTVLGCVAEEPLQEVSSSSDDAETLLKEAATGPLTVVRGDDGDVIAFHGRMMAPPELAGDAEAVGTHFLNAHGVAFGIADPGAELILERRTDGEPSPFGNASAWLTYQRVHRGLPVYGATVRLRVRHASVTSALVQVPLDLDVPDEPAVTEAQAVETVLGRLPAGTVHEETDLRVLNEALLRGRQGPSRLAWAVRTRYGLDVETHFVDASHGEALDLAVNHSPSVLDRAIYSLPSGCPDPASCADWVVANGQQVILESGPVSGVTVPPDATAAYGALDSVYGFFSSELSLDSFDGAGGTIRAYTGLDGEVARVVPIDGVPSIILGDGNAVVDLIAHEFVHMVLTRLRVDLLPGGESAEVQEAIADLLTSYIDGGGVDPWAIGESAAVGTIRSMSSPAIRHVDDRLSTIDPHLNSTIFSHAFFLLTTGLPGFGIEALNPSLVQDLLLGFAQQMISTGTTFDFAGTGMWLTALEMMVDGSFEFDFGYAECSSLVNALAAVGIGEPDSDGDCFPDDLDTCPDMYNPEQLTLPTCRLPIASCRIAPELCMTVVGESDVFRMGCEGGGGAWGGVACTDDGAEAACVNLGIEPVVIEVYYDIPDIDGAREANAAGCLLKPGIWLPDYVMPTP